MSEEQQETHYNEAAQQAFDEQGFIALNEQLGADEGDSGPDFDPESVLGNEGAAPEASQQSVQVAEQEAQVTAMMAIGTFEGLIQTMVHKDFKLPEETKTQAVERYSPLIVKYAPAGMQMFAQWQDEIMAGIFTASVVSSSLQQIKELKAEDRTRAKYDKADAEEQAESESRDQDEQEAA